MTVFPTGVAGTGTVGDVDIIAHANIYPAGIAATGNVGQVLVWGTIVPNQNAGYSGISPSQTPTWSDETPSQTPNWGQIAA
jgi:hypothetical protein